MSITPGDAPSTIAMKRIGKDFQQFDSDTTAMVLLEGQDKLGDDAHRFYDKMIDKLAQDKAHIEHIDNFWGDPLTAAGSQSADGKAAYVELNLRGDQGSSQANDSVAAVERIVDIRSAAAADQGLCDRSRAARPPTGTNTATKVCRRSHRRHLRGDRDDAAIVYRSISTALVMLLDGGNRIARGSKGVIAVLANTNLIGLSTFAVNVLVALTIAASTDYVIFWVGRYQEARSGA